MRKRKTPTADPKRVRCGRYWPDCQKTLAMQGFSGILVEARGVEPLSETVSTRASPGAALNLKFPQSNAQGQALDIGIL